MRVWVGVGGWSLCFVVSFLEDEIPQECRSEKLEKLVTVDFQKTPRTEGGDKAKGSVAKVPDRICLS